MPLIYKLLTGILALTGSLSLLITGEINLVMSLTGIGIFPGYYRFLKGMPQAPKSVIGGLSVLTLITYFIDSFIISNDYFLAVAHLTITFQAIKSFDLREPWDHLQVYFVSLLQLIIVSELTHSIAFGIIFIFFLVAFVTAIVFAHFMKEGTTLKVDIRKPIMSISVLTIFMTVVFFVSLPRISGGLWTKSHLKGIRTAGFTEKVDFGSFGDIKSDPAVVMRVEIAGDTSGPYYWRGMTMDYFDGISWMDTSKDKTWIYKENGLFTLRPFKEENTTVQTIFLEPMDTDVIFSLNTVAAVRAGGTLILKDDSDALFLPFKRNRRVSYMAYSISAVPIIKDNIGGYLQLPKGVTRISQLARSVTGNMVKDIDKARVIEKYLRENFTYSLSPPRPREGTSPVEDFLFSSKRGYCEHYASSMVLMLRAVGVPARLVTGFSGGDPNEYGGYIIVRQSNAHSWVEAAVDGRWERFDPTPSILTAGPSKFILFIDMIKMKWDRYVVSFSTSDQKEIVKLFSMPFRLPHMPHLSLWGLGPVFLLTALAVLLAVILGRVLKLRKHGFLAGHYIRLRNLVQKKGLRITPSTTSSEIVRETVRLSAGGNIREFIMIYEEFRFGGVEMTAEDRARYLRLLKEIKRQIRT